VYEFVIIAMAASVGTTKVCSHTTALRHDAFADRAELKRFRQKCS
jgi:hypothetical protein